MTVGDVFGAEDGRCLGVLAQQPLQDLVHVPLLLLLLEFTGYISGMQTKRHFQPLKYRCIITRRLVCGMKEFVTISPPKPLVTEAASPPTGLLQLL
jgi:hypothetical protein